MLKGAGLIILWIITEARKQIWAVKQYIIMPINALGVFMSGFTRISMVSIFGAVTSAVGTAAMRGIDGDSDGYIRIRVGSWW